MRTVRVATGTAGRKDTDHREAGICASTGGLTRIAERAGYTDLAVDGLGVFDRELSSPEPIKQQWQPSFLNF